MQQKNLHSERESEERKCACRLWGEPLRTLILPLIFVAFLPASLMAQASAQAPIFGNPTQTPLLFQGEPVPVNQASFSIRATTFYDDNVLSNNSERLSDEALSISPDLGITKRSERLGVSFDYSPFLVLYRHISQYDVANHAANLNLDYKLTSRVTVGLHDTFSYQNGVFPTPSGQQLESGLTSLSALNQLIVPYTARVLSNSAGLHLAFAKSQRTSLTLFGDYNQRKLSTFWARTLDQTLYNTYEWSGGLQFQYRMDAHTSFGILLLHQDTTYQGGDVIGNRQRSQVESVVPSLGSRLSPSVTFTVFGGLQYVLTIGQAFVGGSGAGNFQGTAGGSITKEGQKTALDLSLERSVSDGGGVYTSVIYTHAEVGVRRRLVGQWEAAWHAGAAQADASAFQFAGRRIDGLIGGMKISRPLAHSAKLFIACDTWHQVSKGTLPIYGNFDRNQVTVGIDYQFKPLPLGQ